MKHSSFRFIGIAVCMVCTGLAHASTAGDPQRQPAFGAASAPAPRPGMFAASAAPLVQRLTPEQRGEWRFLKDAAASSRFGLDAARMALARSSDTNVRSLAATLVNHYSGTQATLEQMLRARSMAPPMLANEQRKTLNHLAKLQGAKFDREWMDAVGLRAQQDDVALYEAAAVAVRDPQVHGWIERTLPTMQYQLATAQRNSPGAAQYAALSPSVKAAAIKPTAVKPTAMKARVPQTAMKTHRMDAPSIASNSSNLGEGNMLLGPTRPVGMKLTAGAD